MSKEVEIKLARFSRVPPGAAMDISLSKRALRVLVALCGHADKNDICRPSQTRLAKVSNLSRQKVNLAIKELCERQWIFLIGKRRGGGQWPSNVYKINFDKPVEGAIVPQPRHHTGDTDHVTPPVTERRHPTGDTNKSNEQKIKQKPIFYSPRTKSPYQIVLNALERHGLSRPQSEKILLDLDPLKYEEFCKICREGRPEYNTIVNLFRDYLTE